MSLPVHCSAWISLDSACVAVALPWSVIERTARTEYLGGIPKLSQGIIPLLHEMFQKVSHKINIILYCLMYINNNNNNLFEQT